MKIAFETQPLVDDKLTGVGWHEYHLIKNIVNLAPEYDYQMLYFKIKDHKKTPINIKKLEQENCIINKSSKVSYGILRRLWKYVQIDYSYFFGKADLYHFFNFIVPPKVPGKVVLTVHDMVHKTFPKTMTKANFKRLESDLIRSCKQADAIITVSHNTKKEIIEYINIPFEKIYVIPNGVDSSIFNNNYSEYEIKTTKEKYNLPDKYFLYLGTLEPRKNIELIIDAYNLLVRNSLPDEVLPKLVIAGKKGWAYQSILKRVEKYKLYNYVIFPGYIETLDIAIVMSGALSFIFPSLYEGFGMPPLEAMACGIPVIVSNTSSLPEVVGDAGIQVDPKSKEDLYKWMEELIINDELRNNLIQKGLVRAKEFTWEKAAIKTLEVYKQLLQE
jgi:glycosyltransferase involved in cell wall biosynthesis